MVLTIVTVTISNTALGIRVANTVDPQLGDHSSCHTVPHWDHSPHQKYLHIGWYHWHGTWSGIRKELLLVRRRFPLSRLQYNNASADEPDRKRKVNWMRSGHLFKCQHVWARIKGSNVNLSWWSEVSGLAQVRPLLSEMALFSFFPNTLLWR